MFIVLLTYIKKDMESVEKNLEAHKKFLDKYYESGNFILSGRKVPRTGGVIICKANDRSEIEKIIELDPFYINHVANYEIIEFTPTRYAEEIQKLIS